MLQNILSYNGTPDQIEIHCKDEKGIPYTLTFKTGKLEVLLSSSEIPINATKDGEERCVWFKTEQDFYIKIPIRMEDDAVCTVVSGGQDDRKRIEGKSKYIR